MQFRVKIKQERCHTPFLMSLRRYDDGQILDKGNEIQLQASLKL